MEHAAFSPNPWMVMPFVLLLCAIALAPLLAGDWWARHYPKVSLALGAVTATYYVWGLRAYGHVLDTGLEYVQFVALVGSLFVVSGGIHIRVKGEATPLANVLFLLAGAVAANLLGTTGASMLLIRPWIRMNKYRITGHHVVFFIFIVSNVGGSLTPIGDPPLFLGYLKGVPFWWVARHSWPMWASGVGILLAMFYAVDLRNFRRAPESVRESETAQSAWRFEGLPNLCFLAVILGAVFVQSPPLLREGLMLGAAAGSYFTTRKPVHEANHFDLHPIKEVAILFAGIFMTMMPALDWLGNNAGSLLGENPAAGLFYWGAGLLSGVLDNAPTYLCFLKASFGAIVDRDVVEQVQALVQSGGTDLAALAGPHADQVRNTLLSLQKYHGALLAAKTVTADQIRICFLVGNAPLDRHIIAISVASVFFGAATYIGNGPNFMVKAIAERQRVRAPTFHDYVFKYTLPFLLPMVLAVWLLFFR
jgi:Na+/H+ antiporter NhaD/arsenite permease-like protein